MPLDSFAPSPAERFAAAATRRDYPALTGFTATLPFELDPFQTEACRAVERGDNVLVCAPTGAGKTVVGEFAVAWALSRGGKCFYTTPIKALSNQKYGDLAAVYGPGSVGLLTGDTTVNPHAPIIVMTTEVLRNMLYAGSTDLAGLFAVVLDEVHYLADRFRGAVWEEVILHLDTRVSVIGLSATVSNAEEFGDWLRTVRGRTTVIVDEVRPVPLWQHMMVGSGLYDLYAEALPEGGGRRSRQVNPAVSRAIRQIEATARDGDMRGGRRRGGRSAPRWRPTPRPVMVDRLDAAGLLPAIVFIFSRAGCDAAVDQCLRAGVRLTDPAERELIDGIIERHIAGLPPGDLEVLGFHHWRAAWQQGLAAHHAGLLPAFKETVEELFAGGLVKVVFATETLALGINMPARTVVLERLVKYDGEAHAEVTPAEYTQLTGRAGRRGIDIEGHAAVLWSPGVDPAAVAGLAAKRTFPLRSSFRPTYNMVVNLLDRLGRPAARALLQRSFAQFQSDRALVGTAQQVARNEAQLAALELDCELGDVAEYVDLCQRLTVAEKAQARSRAARRRETVAADLAALRPGDVIAIPTGRRRGLAVVLDARPDHSGAVHPLVCTDQCWAGRLDPGIFSGPVPALGRVRLGRHVEHWKPAVRRDLAATLAASGISAGRRGASGGRASAAGDADLEAIQRAVRSHPVHRCPDRQAHVALSRTRAQLAARTAEMRHRLDSAQQSMSLAMDRIAGLLADRGYLAGDSATDAGRILQAVWSESDLLAAECCRRGVWRDLDVPQLAAAVSGLVFESRRDLPIPARSVTGPARDAALAIDQCWREIAAAEQARTLPSGRAPDFGFAGAAATWAAGGTLAEALARAEEDGVELSAGDMVRWCRQLIDLLDQLRAAAPAEMIPQAGAAVAAIRRGVVALGTG